MKQRYFISGLLYQLFAAICVRAQTTDIFSISRLFTFELARLPFQTSRLLLETLVL